jgi:hypothetical protein
MEEGKGRRRGSRFMEETHKIMGVPHVEKCPICGGELVAHFEEIREKLSTEDVGEFEPVGKTYKWLERKS